MARKKKQLISHVGQHMDEHAVVTKAIFGVNTSGCQGERTNHVSIESVIFGTYITYIYIFMYILCVYHSSQVLPRVFVIKLLRWIISRCILSFWPTIWESIGISIWLLPEPLELYIYVGPMEGNNYRPHIPFSCSDSVRNTSHTFNKLACHVCSPFLNYLFHLQSTVHSPNMSHPCCQRWLFAPWSGSSSKAVLLTHDLQQALEL